VNHTRLLRLPTGRPRPLRLDTIVPI